VALIRRAIRRRAGYLKAQEVYDGESPAVEDLVNEQPPPPGTRYRLRGLVVVTLAGLISWALIIWLIVKLLS
jgi:hypothetical protein